MHYMQDARTKVLRQLLYLYIFLLALKIIRVHIRVQVSQYQQFFRMGVLLKQSRTRQGRTESSSSAARFNEAHQHNI